MGVQDGEGVLRRGRLRPLRRPLFLLESSDRLAAFWLSPSYCRWRLRRLASTAFGFLICEDQRDARGGKGFRGLDGGDGQKAGHGEPAQQDEVQTEGDRKAEPARALLTRWLLRDLGHGATSSLSERKWPDPRGIASGSSKIPLSRLRRSRCFPAASTATGNFWLRQGWNPEEPVWSLKGSVVMPWRAGTVGHAEQSLHEIEVVLAHVPATYEAAGVSPRGFQDQVIAHGPFEPASAVVFEMLLGDEDRLALGISDFLLGDVESSDAGRGERSKTGREESPGHVPVGPDHCEVSRLRQGRG